MKVSLPYHDGAIDLSLPGRSGIRIIGDISPEPQADLEGALRSSLENPVGSSPLRDVIPPGGNISILISDLTRGRGSSLILRHLLAILEDGGIERDRVEIVCATGMHRGHSREELSVHLGDEIIERWQVLEHDATDREALVEVGTTGRGNRCFFNKRVVESKLTVIIGTVSFHYFAGYGGGRKLIVPGIAGETTILANHRLSLRDDPGEGMSAGCRPGNLDGNPVHEDMLEGARLLPVPVFVINVVPDLKGNVLFVNAGDLERSHEVACRFLWEHFHVDLKHPCKAVILSAGGYPKDINMLQSHKALRHASYALEEGGLMLAVAACVDGVGSTSYIDAFGGGRNGVADRAKSRYTLNAQTAISTVELAGRFSIYLRSQLDDTVINAFGFCRWEQEHTKYLLEGIPDKDIIILKDGAHFLPWRS